MANSISSADGTWQFISLRGQVAEPTLQLEDISRPGVNGVAVREVHRRAEPFEMIGTRDADDTAAANTLLSELQALQGKLVTLIDGYGVTWNNVVVWKAQRVNNDKILKAAGGVSTNKGALLTVRFLMQLTETGEE